VRVSGDPDEANNGLFYIHSDHLGSTSTLSDKNGMQVGTTTRYTPFGDYRPGSSQNDITDRGFTGQKSNMADLGLYYYNARYYLPSTGRFLSADTIVPDPTNPQSFNRYSYVNNNPLRFTDPTGHYLFEENPDETIVRYNSGGAPIHCANADCLTIQPPTPILEVPDAVAINVSGSGTTSPVHGNAGLEYVFNLRSHQFTTFVVAGGGGSAGAGGSVNVSGVAIYNLGEDNYEYRSGFIDANVTAAAGPGVTAGHAWTPNNYDKGARSYYAGIALGAQLSGSYSYVEYIPIHTVDLDDLTVDEHFVPYVRELVFERAPTFLEWLSESVGANK
jgi:RHS repeat-associated protein